MNEEDKETFKQARPYIVGIVALAMSLRHEQSDANSFDDAEAFVSEFEKRNAL